VHSQRVEGLEDEVDRPMSSLALRELAIRDQTSHMAITPIGLKRSEAKAPCHLALAFVPVPYHVAVNGQRIASPLGRGTNNDPIY
jgi:hypothetical protein